MIFLREEDVSSLYGTRDLRVPRNFTTFPKTISTEIPSCQLQFATVCNGHHSSPLWRRYEMLPRQENFFARKRATVYLIERSCYGTWVVNGFENSCSIRANHRNQRPLRNP
ncbi:hypothetical protein CEXT_629461 [Caerostris extrusa]|uniref:Uncharacterized protein n=1 Tax=Caerostris extrusa TaxID=172846 RepID=A0AAV4V6K3_CAEEX|nr:hypothetical protein CEXT_629461 [Caerostris extrusa]